MDSIRRMPRALRCAVAVLLAAQLSGCGLFAAQTQTVSIDSDPQGADIFVNGNMNMGKTPTTLSLERRDTKFIRFELEGYEKQTVSFRNKPNTLFVLDIVGGIFLLLPFLGLIGQGDFDLEPPQVNAVMKRPGPGSSAAASNLDEIAVDPETVRLGESFTVTATFLTHGDTRAALPNIRMYLVRDGKDLASKPMSIKRRSDGNLEATASMRVESDRQTGSYEVRLTVDGGSPIERAIEVVE